VSIGRAAVAPTEASIAEILQSRAAGQPDRMIFCFLQDGEVESERLTYGELDQRARAIAAELQQTGSPGDRAVLIYPPGLEFIAALFGCFYAGVIAVPVYPPRLGLTIDPFRPLAGIIGDCEPSALLVGQPFVEPVQTAAASMVELSQPRIIPSESLDVARATEWRPMTISRETIALLQYTSGSTGHPRGVMVTHGNILENEFVIQLVFEHHTAAEMGTGVCWLPFYHDMGLIGNVLQAVYVDGPCYLMSPLDLLQRPIRWLEAISRYRAHSSGGPNFAYDLCVNRITDEQKAGLDLSHWELAAIGAEPVSAEVMNRFCRAFEPCGFRREAFYPCYGLAEATLFVSGGDKNAAPIIRPATKSDGEAALVGCGHPWTTHELVIADPVTKTECSVNTVGEIWFRGPSVAAGYWRREQETAESFGASLADSGRGPFLRTGDLGFLDDGELFVTGRLKDLIVIRGQNHYPQDIEETVARQHAAFRPQTGAAFSGLIDDEERLIIVQEIDRRSRRLDLDRLRADVRRAIADGHQLQAHDIVFLRNGTIPKTTSGKVRRHECRQKYLSGQLSQWTPST